MFLTLHLPWLFEFYHYRWSFAKFLNAKKLKKGKYAFWPEFPGTIGCLVFFVLLWKPNRGLDFGSNGNISWRIVSTKVRICLSWTCSFFSSSASLRARDWTLRKRENRPDKTFPKRIRARGNLVCRARKGKRGVLCLGAIIPIAIAANLRVLPSRPYCGKAGGPALFRLCLFRKIFTKTKTPNTIMASNRIMANPCEIVSFEELGNWRAAPHRSCAVNVKTTAFEGVMVSGTVTILNPQDSTSETFEFSCSRTSITGVACKKITALFEKSAKEKASITFGLQNLQVNRKMHINSWWWATLGRIYGL